MAPGIVMSAACSTRAMARPSAARAPGLVRRVVRPRMSPRGALIDAPRPLLPRSGRSLLPLRPRASSKDDDEPEPDWDAEMSIFKKRSMKPGQLATLRQVEGEASLGKVVYVVDDLIIVEGLNNDADVGTVVSFASGIRGVLLWRRNDNLCDIMAPGASGKISVGTPVQCNVQGVVQVVDQDDGTVTKRKYEIAKIDVTGLEGEIVNFLGQVKGSGAPVSLTGGKVPLLARSPNMEDREQINEALFTGVAAVDTLAPLGRGQSILLAGLQGSGKVDLIVESIVGQKGSGVRCVLSLVGEEEGFGEELKAKLSGRGAMKYTTIVEAPKGSSLSQSYLAMCTAMSIGELERDGGGHAFVMHSNLVPMVDLWEFLTRGLMELGPQALGGDMDDDDKAESDAEEMVEYEGMLISASAAQRRQFFAAMIQRAAKMHRRLGAGSLTWLGSLPGTPATGVLKKKKAIIESYTTLSEEQKNRMLKALEQQDQLESLDPDAERRGIRTDVVEEFMSLTDGQIILDGQRDPDTGCMVVNPAASVSRIGNRAYEPALSDVATPIRYSITQADDAARASIDGSAQDDIERALKARAILVQDLEQPVSLPELLVRLLALESGMFDDVEPERIRRAVSLIVHDCWLTHPEVLKEIRNTRVLTEDNRATLVGWLQTREATV